MNAAKALTVADIPRLLGELRQEKFYGSVSSSRLWCATESTTHNMCPTVALSRSLDGSRHSFGAPAAYMCSGWARCHEREKFDRC